MRRSLLAASLLLLSMLPTPARAQEPNDAGNAPPQEGTVLITDTFDDPENGALPKVSPDPTRSRMGYAGGEYVLRTFGAGNARASIPGTYSNYSVAVDAWIVGDSSDNLIEIGLRRRETRATDEAARVLGGKDYRMALQNGRSIVLRRWDDPNGPVLAQIDLPSSFQPSDGRYHLELSATGRNIVGRVNGAVVAAVQDDTYQSGTAWIGVLSNSSTVEARFDNLVVTQRNASAPAPPLDIVLATAAPNAPTSQPTVQAPGSVLLSDNFDDPSSSRLAATSPDASRYIVGYVDGEYEIQTVADRVAVVAVPGLYGDTAISVDARIVGEAPDRWVALACRATTTGGYIAYFQPDGRRFLVSRRDGSNFTDVIPWTLSRAFLRGPVSNRLMLSCLGSTISVTINGSISAATSDATYTGDGEVQILAGALSSGLQNRAHFDNLLVTQRDPSEPPPAIPPPPKPGDVLLADDFSDPATGWLPLSSADSRKQQLRYVDGEYEVRKDDWLSGSVAVAGIPGRYSDVAIRVEGRIVGDGDYLALTCRANESGQYRLSVYPWSREYFLHRVDVQGDSSRFTTLAHEQSSAVRVGTASNRMELSCAGRQIEARVNDTRVASVEDEAHRNGGLWIGASANRSTATARFDNLMVTQR